MTGPFGKYAFAALVLAQVSAFVPSAHAQTVEASTQLTGHLRPQSEEEAKILLDRVEKAAADVCGASNFSVVEYARSVRRSSCWRKSVADAVVRIGSPILSDVYGRESR